jgi:immune inhibitor A
MKRTSPPLAVAPLAVARFIGLLAALTAAAAVSAAPAEKPDGPDFMPAHPELLARAGKTGLVRLTGEQTPVEMYTESRDARAKSGADKISGSGTCLVLLWQFTDHPADVMAHPASAYQSLLFSTGTWPTGSMNDYFREVSYGAFGVSGAPIGWTTSGTTYASYVPHDASTTRTMIQNAIAQLDPGVNFALYDNDGPDGVPHSADDDGYVDALFFVHAGPGQEETGNVDDIWSHAWSFPGGLATGDGVRIGRYSVEPEETASGGLVAIGVFCHEYGHVLGLPDLYDTDYSSSGVGEWCLMSGGSWNTRSGGQWGSCPAHPLAWCKQELGWLAPTAVTTTTFGVTLPPSETSPSARRIFRGGVTTGDEYFLVENRRRLGFDAGLTRRQIRFGLPAPEGLLVLHVDESSTSNALDTHRLVDVVEATPWFTLAGEPFEHLDGVAGWEATRWLDNANGGDNGDLWPGFASASADTTDWLAPRSRNRFADDTVPSAVDYFCEQTGIAITNITLAIPNVQVDFEIGTTLAAVAPPTVDDLTWNFENGSEDWQFCNSFVHVDETLAAGCVGAAGLWFGVDDPTFACPPGYGNGWNDFTGHTIVVQAGASVTLRHKYDLEPDYDYGWVEVRCAGDSGAPWHVAANFTGDSGGCVLQSFIIPAAAISECADPETGYAKLDLRLRFTSDSGWSAEDGDFCGFGWWIDELTVGNAITAVGDTPAATALPTVLLPASPNPFNPLTTVRFHLPSGAREVRLVVHDQRGRLVRTLATGPLAPGWLERTWDGRDASGQSMASGVYFARLTVDGEVKIQKLALVK